MNAFLGHIKNISLFFCLRTRGFFVLQYYINIIFSTGVIDSEIISQYFKKLGKKYQMTVLMYVLVNGNIASWIRCGLQSWVSKVFSHLVNKFCKEKVCDFRDFQVIKSIELCSYSESIYGESFPLTQVRNLNLGPVWNWHMLSFYFCKTVFCWVSILQGLISLWHQGGISIIQRKRVVEMDKWDDGTAEANRHELALNSTNRNLISHVFRFLNL